MSKKKPRPAPVPYPVIPGIVDAHTHLTSCNGEIGALIARAHAAGVERICTVGDGLAEAEEALNVAKGHDSVYAACAIHPTKAQTLDASAQLRLRELAEDPRCVAVGETGLDTYWIAHDPENTAALEVQIEALHWHAQVARDVNKTLMIHNREADEHLMRELGGVSELPNVMLHCFSSPLAVAKQSLERGYILSFCGNVTFKRNDDLRTAAALAPAEQILIETDAPYMTPEPFRGSRNEPFLIGHTYKCVADARGIAVEELAEIVAANFSRVFGV
ncbi:MAG: TatD family hydrolase [Corynebacterium sp.]|nr:TatD family hydrolase [Corynebacterium sp.]